MTIRLRRSSNFVYSTGPSVGNPIAVSGSSGSVQFNDGGVFGGDAKFIFDKSTKTLTVTNISGSLTKLEDGSSYLVAGPNITISSASNGSITISSTGGGGGGGSGNWNELLPSPRLNSTASISIAGGLGSSYAAQSAGSDVFFYVSGSLVTGDKSVFGGDIVVSGSIEGKNGLDITGGIIEISGTISVSGSMQVTGSIGVKGDIVPDSDTKYNLGAPASRWANVYTGDLHLRNDRGDWTIVEEKDYLCVVNNITGKKYKMMLQPIDDEV